MRRVMFPLIVLVVFLSLSVCSGGYCQTWRNYVKEDGYGKLLVEGNYLWSAGAVLYRFDVNTPETTIYRRDDGLPENNLRCIAVDSQGTKWLGTASRGLWLFDGVAFGPFQAQQELGKQNVGYLAVDSADNVWMAAAGSKELSVWDGHVLRFYGEESGLEGSMRGIACDGTTAWCCTTKGIFRLEGEAWTKEREGSHFEPFSDSGGNLWALQGYGSYAVRFDGAEWSQFSLGSDAGAGGLSEGPDGSIWVGIYDGVARFDGESWTKYRPGEGMPEDWPELGGIMSTAVDANNVLWATSSMGVITYDGETWSQLPMGFSIPMDHLTSACWTPDGLLFHTYHGGRGFFDGISWDTLRAESPGVAGRSSMLYDSARDRVWIAAGSLTFFDLQSHDYVKLQGDNVPRGATCMAFDMADNLWVGTSTQGIYRLTGENWTGFTTEDGLSYDEILGIAVAPNSEVWAATRDRDYTQWAVDVFTDGSWHQEPFESEGWIVGLASDQQHNIWALMQITWDPSFEAIRTAPDGIRTQWPLDVSLTGLLHQMFVSPGGDVCITGYYGALRFVEDEWRSVTPADGLATGLTEYIAFAPHNEAWICTETALSRLDESPIPWLDLHLAGASGTTLDFVPGDTLNLHAELHNPMTPRDVSIYVAFQLPGDETLFFWPTFSTYPAPAFTGALPDKLFWGPEPLFQHTFNGSEPAGSYFVKGAILSNQTGGIIGEITEVPFTFTP